MNCQEPNKSLNQKRRIKTNDPILTAMVAAVSQATSVLLSRWVHEPKICFPLDLKHKYVQWIRRLSLPSLAVKRLRSYCDQNSSTSVEWNMSLPSQEKIKTIVCLQYKLHFWKCHWEEQTIKVEICKFLTTEKSHKWKANEVWSKIWALYFYYVARAGT